MKVTVASAQYPITFHKSFQNWQEHTEHWIKQAAAGSAQLCLFPEYGLMELTSLLSAEAQKDLKIQVSELDQFKDKIIEFYSLLAKKHNIIIVAPSLPILENERIINRTFVFSDKGLLAGYQDKFFMTRFENEQWQVSKPENLELQLFCRGALKFGIQICYDNEFPLGAFYLAQAGANLILSPSCTEKKHGSTRVHTCVKARAQELQLYAIVSQTVGEALWSIAVDENYGFAAVYAPADINFPDDGVVSSMRPQTPGWHFQELDLSLIEKVRSSGQVFNYKDTMRQKIGFESEIKIKSVEI